MGTNWKGKRREGRGREEGGKREGRGREEGGKRREEGGERGEKGEERPWEKGIESIMVVYISLWIWERNLILILLMKSKHLFKIRLSCMQIKKSCMTAHHK